MTHSTTQLVLLHLATLNGRQLFNKSDMIRNFMNGQSLRAIAPHLSPSNGGGTRTANQERPGDVADEWAGDSDNSCSSYRGVTLQHRFDLTRQYLLTAANDDIRLSTENAYIPLGVYDASVTRIVPAIITESPTVRG